MPIISDQFQFCKGNAVRIREILKDQYNEDIPYSTLTYLIREMELRDNKKKQRSGEYMFGPGKELQHDTSPHDIILGGKKLTAQCAGIVLAYSKKLFIQYYPNYTRFEAKVFLTEAFRFFNGSCPRCIIDNTHVVVARGSGPDAEIAPEMEAFGQIFNTRFVPHRIGHSDRKAVMERNFYFIERNFLAGRTFTSWHDLNTQARKWCIEVANDKPKRSLGMSPEAAYLQEKQHLQSLPPYIPEVYKILHRAVDMAGYVIVDTNRYSVPERLVGKNVEVHKTWDRIRIYFGNKKVADHARCIDKRDAKIIKCGHHQPFATRSLTHKAPCKEEKLLLGHSGTMDRYVHDLKKRLNGRGVRQMQRLLNFKRTYPEDAFQKAISQAQHYGLYDLTRLEQLILSFVAGDFFNISEEE